MADPDHRHRKWSADNALGADGRPDLPWSEEFQDDPDQVKEARDATRAVLVLVGFRVDPDDAALLVSELATNARRFGPFRLVIERPSDDRVRVSVIDRGRGDDRPEVRHAKETDKNGRGLFLVEEFSDRWGYERHCTGGLCVWFELIEQSEKKPEPERVAAVAPCGSREAESTDDR